MASAWKRRSAGSRYSTPQASHIANGAIVVLARSNGMLLTMLETRSAMRAVGERVAETALERVFNFRDAGVADRRVRRDLRMSSATNTLGNPELMRQMPTKGLRFDTVDLPERWWLALHAIDKGSDRSFAAADTDENPVGVIQDFARKAEIARNAPDRRPKSHALAPGRAPEFPTRLIRPGARRFDANSWRRVRHHGGPLLNPRVERRKTLPRAC